MDDAIRTESLIIMEKAISLAYKLGIRCIQMAGYDVYYEPQSKKLTLASLKACNKPPKWQSVQVSCWVLRLRILRTSTSLSKFEILKPRDPVTLLYGLPRRR